MYYRILPYIIFRDCSDFGYLTDNRNYGYDTASKSSIKVGERILSKTGSVFYSILSEKAQSLSEIVEQLVPLFPGVSPEALGKDAEEFFHDLSNDGFILCGDNRDGLQDLKYFSYENSYALELLSEMQVNNGDSFEMNWGTKYHLVRVHVDVSGLCNEHCVHCFIPDSFKRNIMSKELFNRIIEQCIECKVLNITISGGEPMLNPNLSYFIEVCREKNFSINVLSNLTLLTDEYVKIFEKTPLLSIQTSLYSMNPEIHETITQQKGSFIKTKNAIEILHKHNIPMQINCPIMKQNKDSYQSVINWAQSLNIEASSDYMLFGSIDGSSKNLQCRLSIPEVETIMRQQGVDSKRENRSGKDGDIGIICPVCTNSLGVSHNGDVYPCEGLQSVHLGNTNEDSLASIWDNSPLVQQLRELNYDDFPKCRTCEDQEYCSRCLIRNANESLNHDYKDVNPYFCEIARRKRQIVLETKDGAFGPGK